MTTQISIIIPVYNKEKRLSKCLDSILAQKNGEIEIICIDDNSSDNSYRLLLQYAAKYEFIKVYRNKENKGAGYTRNRGLEKACGEYIWFIDADDTIVEGSLNKLLNIIIKEELDSVFFDMQRNINGKTYSCRYIDSSIAGSEIDEIIDGPKLFRYIYENGMIWQSACRQIFRKEMCDENNIYFSEGVICEDTFYSLQIFLCSAKTRYIQEDYYHYYKFENSVTYNTGNIDTFIGKFYAFYKMISWCNKLLKDECLVDTLTSYIGEYYAELKEYFDGTERNIFENKLKVIEKEAYYFYKILFCQSRKEKLVDLVSDKLKKELANYQRVIIYGAGENAKLVANIADICCKPIVAYAVSDGYDQDKSNPKYILGVQVKNIQELVKYADDETIIVLTTRPIHNEEIRKNLREKGFFNIIELLESNS